MGYYTGDINGFEVVGSFLTLTPGSPPFGLDREEYEDVIRRLERGEDPEKIADYYWARRPSKT